MFNPFKAKALMLLLFVVLLMVVTMPVATAQDDQTAPQVVYVQAEGEPTFWDVAQVVTNAALILMIAGVGVFLRKLNFAEVDASAVKGIEKLQTNRVEMDILERAYQNANAMTQETVKTLGNVLIAVSGMIPGNTDKKVGEFLVDVSVPGAPIAEPPVDDGDTAFNLKHVVAEGGNDETV